MPTNGNRPGERAVHSVGELSKNAAESTRHPATTQAPRFVLELEARPGASGIRALRWLLKSLARQHGFRCLDARAASNRRGRR
jgi:hypothetical protein